MIDIKNLTMVYSGRAVLDNVNLSLDQGQIVGLLGENGSGKTTLIRILAGLERNYQGVVSICGNRPGSITNDIVAYQPDHLPLDENLKIEEVCSVYSTFYEDFDLNKFYKLLNSFEISKELKIKECSKGMKEKIQIALTLSRKAKIYILDEPMSGIDPKSRKIVLNTIIDNFDYEGLMIISTHLVLEVEKVLDRALFLDNGKLMVNESVDDIRENHHMGVEEYFTEVL